MTLVNTDATLRQAVSLLTTSKRRVPLIVVTQRHDRTGPVLPGARLQNLLGKRGIVRVLSGAMHRPFNRHTQAFGLRRAGVRLYEPMVSLSDPSARHPYWSESAVEAMGVDELNALIIEHCDLRRRFSASHQHTTKNLGREETEALVDAAVKRPLLSVKRS